MNPFYKVYCRGFQTALRLAIPLLPYRKPEVLQSEAALPPILKAKGIERVLIVTDPGVAANGLTQPLEQALTAGGITWGRFDKTVPNPTTDTVEAALRMYRAGHFQALAAVGGGSSMDCAKAVGIRAVRPRTPLGWCRGILKVWKPLPLLTAIPTTAGTGSETTLAAVIVDAKTRHKYAINDFPLIPRYAVLDPQLTVSLPPALTASTGMDALTHAVEAYIGRSTTRDTRADALAAVRLIFANLDAAYSNGADRPARAAMLEASFRAGCAFTKSYVGYVHAMAHALGGAYDVPHGYANAVLLPLVLKAYGPAAHAKLARLAAAAGVADPHAPPAQAAAAFIEAVRAMKRRYGIGDTVPELRRADIPELARRAAREANPLYPVPVLWDAAQIAALYEKLLEE